MVADLKLEVLDTCEQRMRIEANLEQADVPAVKKFDADDWISWYESFETNLGQRQGVTHVSLDYVI